MLKALRGGCTSYVLGWFRISLRDSWWSEWGSSDGRSYIPEDYLSILQKDQLGRDELVELQLMLSSLRGSSLQSLFLEDPVQLFLGWQILLSQDMVTVFILQKVDVHIYDGLFEKSWFTTFQVRIDTSLCSQVILWLVLLHPDSKETLSGGFSMLEIFYEIYFWDLWDSRSEDSEYYAAWEGVLFRTWPLDFRIEDAGFTIGFRFSDYLFEGNFNPAWSNQCSAIWLLGSWYLVWMSQRSIWSYR